MNYKIKVSKLILKRNTLTISFSGFIESDSELTRPKWILYFVQGTKDRRIPLVIQELFWDEGRWFFAGSYDYLLDCLFWKPDNPLEEISMYLNLQLGEHYEEKMTADLTPEVFETDQKFYEVEILSSCLKILPQKTGIDKGYGISRLRIKIYNWFSFAAALVLSPWLFCTARLAEKGYLPYASERSQNGKSAKRRMVGDMNARMKMLSGHKISPFGFKINLLNIFFALAKTRKVQKNKVAFLSVRRRDLSGNMEYVYTKFRRYENIHLELFLPGRDIKKMSLAEMYKAAVLCATSKVIVLDEYTSFLYELNLRQETKVFQLWHACGAFKTFGYSRLGKKGGTIQESVSHKNYDYVTVSSSGVRKWYAEGFGISTDHVYATGVPRTDVFFDEEYKSQIRKYLYESYPQCKGKRVILFVPTFRGETRTDAHYPMEKFDLEHFLSNIPEDYLVIIKHHPFVKEKHKIPEVYADRVLDLSGESEVNDLLFITDLVITDYSSVVFEASLLDIPMLFYTFDLQSYIRDRDFYFDFESFVPGKICSRLEEVEKAVQKEEFYHNKVREFAEKYFDHLDGKASERVAGLIYKALNTSGEQDDLISKYRQYQQ